MAGSTGEQRQDGAEAAPGADGAVHDEAPAEVRDAEYRARLERDLAEARKARPPGRPSTWVLKGF